MASKQVNSNLEQVFSCLIHKENFKVLVVCDDPSDITWFRLIQGLLVNH